MIENLIHKILSEDSTDKFVYYNLAQEKIELLTETEVETHLANNGEILLNNVRHVFYCLKTLLGDTSDNWHLNKIFKSNYDPNTTLDTVITEEIRPAIHINTIFERDSNASSGAKSKTQIRINIYGKNSDSGKTVSDIKYRIQNLLMPSFSLDLRAPRRGSFPELGIFDYSIYVNEITQAAKNKANIICSVNSQKFI